MSGIPLSAEDRQSLLRIARLAIEKAVHGQRPLPLDPGLPLSAALRHHGACFVSLHKHGQLRGCIGTLEAIEPLADSVARHAAAAAMRDPRFACVQETELAGLVIEISVLSHPEPLAADSMDDLLAQLQAGVDGLMIAAGHHRATFLPVVWEQLPQAQDFLDALWRKAGLAPRAWPEDLRVWRYEAIKIGP